MVSGFAIVCLVVLELQSEPPTSETVPVVAKAVLSNTSTWPASIVVLPCDVEPVNVSVPEPSFVSVKLPLSHRGRLSVRNA